MPDVATVTNLRAARNEARARFDGGLQQMRSDMDVRNVGTLIADKLQSEAVAAGSYALDVIEDNKGIVGGTVAALGIWFFREPITTWIKAHFGDSEAPDDAKAEFKDMIDE